MKKDEFQITRYTIKKENEEYCVYIIPDSNDKDYISFYIEKVGYANLYHTVGIPKNERSITIEELIENNIDDWINIAEENCID